MTTVQSLEALLFVAGKPLTVDALAKALKIKKEAVEEALAVLAQKYNAESGVVLVRHEKEVQLVSAPGAHEVTGTYLKAEITGELTKPQLETLTVVAYMGPLSKPALDQFRGVNCTLILRNLMIRGLVEERVVGAEEPVYDITIDFLKYLGLQSRGQLPEFNELRSKVAYGDGIPHEKKIE